MQLIESIMIHIQLNDTKEFAKLKLEWKVWEVLTGLHTCLHQFGFRYASVGRYFEFECIIVSEKFKVHYESGFMRGRTVCVVVFL